MLLILVLILSVIFSLLTVLGVGFLAYRLAKRRGNAHPVVIGIAIAMIPLGLFSVVSLFAGLETAIGYAIGVGFVIFTVGLPLTIMGIVRKKISSDQTHRPLLIGAGGGVGAWSLGYAITYLLVGSEVQDVILNRIQEDIGYSLVRPASYELVGWVFYNAHFFDIHVSDCCRSTETTVIGGDGFTPLLFVIPPILLFVAGFFIAGFSLSRYHGDSNLTIGVSEGLTILPGYLFMLIVGQDLFWIGEWFGEISAGPSGPLILTGLLYPLVFGSLGGFLAALTIKPRHRPAE